jgi:hypothetical protein
MKRSICLAAVIGSALAACGGGSGGSNTPAPTTATISGTVAGFPGGTLLLGNSGVETIAVTANGGFAFAKPLSEGSPYHVTVLGQPSGTNCQVGNGAGTIAPGTSSISNVSVTCSEVAMTFIRFNVGVTVSGLFPGNSVTLMNDGTDTLTAADNGLFVFPSDYFTEALYEGRAGGYDVTVKGQPSNQSCTVADGSGVLTAAQNNFVDIAVSCQ